VKSIRTVCGEMRAEEAGLICVHEHLILDMTHEAVAPKTEAERALFHGGIRMENLGVLRRNPYLVRTNLELDSVEDAADELRPLIGIGCNLLLDLTSVGLGRDVRKLRQISERTGLNIACGCGLFVRDSRVGPYSDWSADAIARWMLREIRDGIEDTGIRPGVIGEIGTSEIIHPLERRSLLAAAAASTETGLPVYVHTYPWNRAGLEAIDAAFYKPGCQMLYNIIPAQLRGRVAALVQGAVRRVGELAGSGLLWVLKSHLSPLQLNVVGPVFALAWLWCTWRLRRSYSDILYRSLSEKHVNFAELEGRDLRSLMSAQARAALEKNLDAARPATALMAARLLSRSGVAGWRALVGARLAGRRPETQAEMLRIVSTGPPDEAAKALLGAAAAVHPSVLPELAALLRRTAPVDGAGLFRKWRSSPDARLAAEALLGLGAPDAEWGMQRLDSKEPGVAAAAVYFLGEAGCRGCLERIAALAGSEAPELRAACAAALGRLGLPRSSERWRLLQADADPRVRLKALEGLAALKDPATVRNAVEALGDEDGAVREGARALIAGHGEAAIPLLTEALPRAGVFTRTALMAMLDDLGVKEQTLLSFIDAKVEEGYRAVAMLRCAEEIPPGRSREVLSLLCRNRLSDATYEVFRALGMLLKGGQVQFIQESYDDRDESVREQALEALENALTPEIARKLLPLLEDLPIDLKLAAGERHYRLGAATIGGILGEMLGSPHGADALCGLMCVGEACRRGRPPAATALRETAERRIAALKIQGGKAVEDLMEKVLTLKGVPIFAHLQFKELLAIASIAREETFDPGDRIIRQGERGHAMYLIVSGKVRILSHAEGDAQEVQLAALGENDYFGEMALFDDSPRSATAVADGPVTALKIEKREFRDMLREYPGVSIMICEEFCRRLRRTIGKVGIQGQLSSND